MSVLNTKLTMAAGNASKVSYWINVITGVNVNNFTGINIDNNGDVIISGKQENGAQDDVYVAKIDVDGAFVWSKYIELGTQYGQSVSNVFKPAIDNNDNIYTTFNVAQSGSTYINDWAVAKIASNGSLSADSIMAGTAGGYDRGDCIIWNGTQLVSSGDYDNTNYSCLVRMDTSLGSITGTQYTGSVMNPISLTWDGSNYYMTAQKNAFYGAPAYVIKVNSAFNLQWCSGLGRDVSGSASSPFFYKAISIGTDVYACGRSYSAKINNATYSGLLWKANSNGTQQWQRLVADASGLALTSLYHMAKTSDDKLVVVGLLRTTADSTNKVYVAKIDPSTPSIEWELTLSLGYSGYAWDVVLDAEDNIYISGTNFVCKLPSDGSITGTFGSIVITSTSYGISTPVTPESTDTQSLGGATPSISDQGGSFSIADQLYTESLQIL